MEDNEYLAHHGVKGMKWGVRKDGHPQGWQGSGHVKRASSTGLMKVLASKGSAIKRLGSATIGTVNKAKKAYKQAKQLKGKHEAKKIEKALKKERESSEGIKNREIALTTHDPRELAKYQHLLTDSELNDRANRLSKEASVRKMASQMDAEKKSGFETFKKNADWVMKTPVFSSAIKTGEAWASQRLGLTDQSKETIKKSYNEAKEKLEKEKKG